MAVMVRPISVGRACKPVKAVELNVLVPPSRNADASSLLLPSPLRMVDEPAAMVSVGMRGAPSVWRGTT